MDAELRERALECLRGLEIGESISADGIADEIGHKLSDVYDALEILEEARLVELHPAYRKGSDPTYTLTTKGKHHAPLKAVEEPEPVEEDRCAPEVRPSADRMCRFCKKEMEPNKVRRHERFCIKNPDRDMPGKSPKHNMPEPVPAPAEYAEESNATHVLDFEVPLEGHITPADESDFPEMPEIIDEISASEPDLPDEVPDHSPANNVDGPNDVLGRFLERVQSQDALVLKGSPGMDAALRLIAFCQKMAGSGAQVSVDATVQVSEGFHIHVDLCVPAPKEESDE